MTPRISHNFLWMAAANITGSLFNILIFIYMARVLMPEALGAFSYAFTVIFFLANFIDLGLSTYGVREIAKDRGRFSAYVSEIISFRLVAASALCILAILVAAVIPAPLRQKVLIAESSLMLIGIALASEWAFQGIEKMKYVFISFAATSCLQLCLMLTFIKRPEDVFKAPLLYFVAMIPVTVIYLHKLDFRFGFSRTDLINIFSHLSGAFAIWGISLCAQVYNNLDVVILGFFRSIEEVGYFTIVRRIVGGIAVLLVFLAGAVLPRLSMSHNKSPEQFASATRSFLKLSVFLAIVIAAPLILASDRLITLTVGPEYLPAGVPLKIMAVGLIFILFNLPHSTG
ncbi:MAG TPA: flippase, partial [Candidatus Omnitrophota bacterium]|nr:flippase [Candidatus Omnitrophota bacterium]